MAYYNRLEKGHTDRCYTFLLNCVRRYLERQRQDKAKAERSRGTGRTALAAAGEKKGACYAFKRGQCTKGNDCPYKHVRENSVDPKKKEKGPKGKGKGRSASPGERPRICKYYLRGECNKPKGQCEFNHPASCRFYPKRGVHEGERLPLRAPAYSLSCRPSGDTRAEGDLRRWCRECD